MAQKMYPAKDIKILVWIGGIFAVLLMALPIIIVSVIYLRSGPGSFPASSTTQSANGLGEEGSACGGPMRLPCRPGLSCETAEAGELGVCVKAQPAVESHRVGMLDEACGETSGRCGVGLACKTSPGTTSGVCIGETATSPKVLSVRLDGMQQDQGWYRAEPGTDVKITVQAVNAKSASVYLEPYSTGTARTKLVDLEREEGGTFVGTFKVPSHLNAELDVIVRDDGGSFSGMSVKAAATN